MGNTSRAVIRLRHRARELAVQLLYAIDITVFSPSSSQDVIDVFFSEDGFAATEGDDVREYVKLLVNGVCSNLEAVDELLLAVLKGWRLERLDVVGRSILRLCIFEAFVAKSVPVSVAIAEAVELASMFGTDDAPRFVNGVLSKVAKTLTAS